MVNAVSVVTLVLLEAGFVLWLVLRQRDAAAEPRRLVSGAERLGGEQR